MLAVTATSFDSLCEGRITVAQYRQQTGDLTLVVDLVEAGINAQRRRRRLTGKDALARFPLPRQVAAHCLGEMQTHIGKELARHISLPLTEWRQLIVIGTAKRSLTMPNQIQ